MNATPAPDWIAVDWGTSNLRAWSMLGASMLDGARSRDGISTLDRDGFEPALESLIRKWSLRDPVPIIACGMVGSRRGWVEAPYLTVPCAPLAGGFTSTTFGAHPVYIVAGLRQNVPADVMRGEETQIAGFLALNPGWDGVICLPGTHTKWVEVSAGEVISFQTYMTGEMFALLSEQSVLRYSVTGEGWDADAFDVAVDDAMSKPEHLAARLFSLRAGDLLNNTDPATGRAQLSGLLIGAELAASRPYWLGRQIAIIGASAQSDIYASALKVQGVPAIITNAERMTLEGLIAAHRLLKDDV